MPLCRHRVHPPSGNQITTKIDFLHNWTGRVQADLEPRYLSLLLQAVGRGAGSSASASRRPSESPSVVEGGRPPGDAPLSHRLPLGRPSVLAPASGEAAATMGEAESSAGAVDVKPPCPAVGPVSVLAAPEPVPQATSEEVAAAAAAATTTTSISSAAATTSAVAMMTTTTTTAPPPLPVSVVWSPEVEVCLFHAMLGHKPVGVNRHFHMICIRDKFSQNIGRQISSKVIWDHLSTMYDMQALHESEILPFPNSEKNFSLPDEMIQEVKEGKVMIEDDVKEEIKEEMESHAGSEEVYASMGSLAKASEKTSSKEKERSSSESGSKEGADKRKRNRVTEKVLNANSNPSSPSAAKRRRT
ncbi:MRG/MORF4L-binding protein [Rhineura floridana]|uniref:MRG/MORF4L-binding protein n=1 Tax=Rhineura floridana TaxID=261503 RepID=UPI002AC866C4|nr:MRG/MORF4L-binding protein [Rhineura floridana]